ncbi:hypothetical protein pdam_00004314 [Pocillopora damicornis]|uniref:C2 domain-containing protein n=1 Tax=Pocillopora damicornis TaxID=46731 RepID=A0A3M6T8D9_POCDA|nr:hypothetical protein pdam_00004314 [Pocillopora damicornis]
MSTLEPVREVLGFENLVFSVFEFICGLTETPKCKKTVKKFLDELIYFLVLYMQITEEQPIISSLFCTHIPNNRQVWTSNPNQFAEDEDDDTFSFSVRIAVQDVLLVISGTLFPEFEETFEFTVPPEEFSSRAVLFHIFDKETVGSNNSLGQVNIELKYLDLDEPIRKRYPLADLKNESYKRAEWAQNAVAQEFREAMYAHALYRHPIFLRGIETKGRKLYSLSSRSAGSSSKVFLVNGIPG